MPEHALPLPQQPLWEVLGQVPDLLMHEAAVALGVSLDTIKRRVKRGELPGQKDERGRWRVSVDAPARPSMPQQPAPAPTPVAPADAPAIEPALAASDVPEHAPAEPDQGNAATLIEQLRAEVAFLRARVEQAEVERAELRRLLAAAVQVRQLPAEATRSAPFTASESEAVDRWGVSTTRLPRVPRRAEWWHLWRWLPWA